MSASSLRYAVTPQGLKRRHYAGLAMAFLGLAVYGSLVPFQFQSLALDEAVARVAAMPFYELRIESRSDWVANILLFIPVGYLLMGALCVDRSRLVGAGVALLVVPLCLALSVAIEFTQLYFPARTASISDVAAQSIGALIGTLTWLACGQRITDWARQVWTAVGSRGLGARLLPAYVLLLVVVHVMPLDLTISPGELYHKYREGRVVLVPFSAPSESLAELVSKRLWNLLYFLPTGLLAADWLGRSWRSWPRVLAFGLLLAGLIEFLQLFVYSRYCDTTDILTGALAVLMGWGAAQAWSGYRQTASTPTAAGGPLVEKRAKAGVAPAAVQAGLFLAWLGAVLMVNWQPFDFTDGRAAIRRLEDISFVPFADYYAGSEYHAFDQFLHKSLLFLPLGVLLAFVLPLPARWQRGLCALLAGLSLSLVVEAGQLFLPTRYPSVTDVLIATSAAWLGFVIACRVRAVLASKAILDRRVRELCR